LGSISIRRAISRCLNTPKGTHPIATRRQRDGRVRHVLVSIPRRVPTPSRRRWQIVRDAAHGASQSPEGSPPHRDGSAGCLDTLMPRVVSIPRRVPTPLRPGTLFVVRICLSRLNPPKSPHPIATGTTSFTRLWSVLSLNPPKSPHPIATRRQPQRRQLHRRVSIPRRVPTPLRLDCGQMGCHW